MKLITKNDNEYPILLSFIDYNSNGIFIRFDFDPEAVNVSDLINEYKNHGFDFFKIENEGLYNTYEISLDRFSITHSCTKADSDFHISMYSLNMLSV